jgi:hypothetical protein
MGIYSSSTRAMDELVFTNPGWPNVTPCLERSGRGMLAGFHCEMANHFGSHQ